MTELWAFRMIVGMVLVIPLVAGLTGAFGGLEGMAVLFGVDDPVSVHPALRNSLRAITFMFFGLVPMMLWTLAKPRERIAPFRIVITCAWLAGFARLTGYLVDGRPNTIEIVFMIMELAGMPLLLAWHWRLVRRAARSMPGT